MHDLDNNSSIQLQMISLISHLEFRTFLNRTTSEFRKCNYPLQHSVNYKVMINFISYRVQTETLIFQEGRKHQKPVNPIPNFRTISYSCEQDFLPFFTPGLVIYGGGFTWINVNAGLYVLHIRIRNLLMCVNVYRSTVYPMIHSRRHNKWNILNR